MDKLYEEVARLIFDLKTFKSISGVFYVKDAETEVDNRGRKIIAAQDFVKEEKVKQWQSSLCPRQASSKSLRRDLF